MGSFFCCSCGDELEEFANPNSLCCRRFSCFRRLFHLIFNGNGATFERMDGRGVMLSFQGGSPSSSAGPSIAPEDIPLTDASHLITRLSSYDADQRYSFSQRDRLVSRHEKIFRSGSSSGSLHLGSVKKQDITESEEREIDLSEYDKFRPGKTSFWMEYPVSSTEDEDVCPTCLEEYTDDNPKILTNCCHHFHLGCIYEWMERSDKCPVCGKEMEFCETP